MRLEPPAAREVEEVHPIHLDRMTMSSATLEELWPGVEAAKPDDPAPLLVCADLCDERNKPSLAYALRWCAAHKRRPFRRADVSRIPWQWIRDQKRYATGGLLSLRKVANRREAVLSPLVFAAGNIDESQHSLSSQLGAYHWVAAALAKLRAVVEMRDIVLPPQPAIIRTDPLTCSQCGIMRERSRLECPVCRSVEVKA